MKWWILCIGATMMLTVSAAHADDTVPASAVSPKETDSKVAGAKLKTDKKVVVAQKENSSKKEAKASTKKNKTTAKKKSPKKSKKTENKSESATFVDRDGDGINDGKEHRFHSKSKKDKKANRRQLMRKRAKSGSSNAR